MQSFTSASHDAWGGCDCLETSRISTNAFHAFGIDRDMSHLAGETRRTRPKFSVQNDCAADAVTDHHVKDVATTLSGANFELAVGSCIGVVLNFNS